MESKMVRNRIAVHPHLLGIPMHILDPQHLLLYPLSKYNFKNSQKQVALLPSGVQVWNSSVLAASSERFAYCSTLALYIYRMGKGEAGSTLERVITGHLKTITGCCWSPLSANLVATSGLDGTIRLWDAANTGSCIKTVSLDPLTPTAIEFSPTESKKILCATYQGHLKVLDYVDGRSEQIDSFSIAEEGYITRIRYNPHRSGIFCAGFRDGSVRVYDANAKKCLRTIKAPQPIGEIPVSDLQWDPLSQFYLLVSYINGSLALFDTEGSSETELHSFDKQAGGISAIVWQRGVPGGFHTLDSRTGALRSWNVSQRAPTAHVKLRGPGVQYALALPNSAVGDDSKSDRFLCSFTDGTVGLYDAHHKRFDFQSSSGHTETIFDCQFSSHSPDILATSSFDGSVKIWNIESMDCIQSMQGDSGVIYSISWAPGRPLLSASTSSGDVLLFETERGSLVRRFQLHKDHAYKVCWNPFDSTILASSSKDCSAVVFKEDGRQLMRYKHPNVVFGCDWSPLRQGMLATGCHDNIVRIFNASNTASEHAVLELKGHKAQVFNVKWSPLVPEMLLSGSNDRTCRVWNVDTGSSVELVGHTNNVRALAFSPELPHVCMSGSWDGTIRIWDVKSGGCLSVVHEHHADVYGLTVHPRRPFVIASSSRDTTLRLWTQEPLVAGIKAQAILGAKPLTDCVATPDPALKDMKLLGTASAALTAELRSIGSDEVERMRKLFSFFSFPYGMRNLWNLISSISRRQFSNASAIVAPSSPSFSSSSAAASAAASSSSSSSSFSVAIPHCGEIVAAAEGTARALESVRLKRFGAGVGQAKKEDQLAQAAAIFGKLGKIREQCDLLFELGEMDRAVSLAPAVSLEYWRELCARRAAELMQKGDEEAVPILIASGEHSAAVEYLVSRGQLEDALLISKTAADGGFSSILASISLTPSAEQRLLSRASSSLSIQASSLESPSPVPQEPFSPSSSSAAAAAAAAAAASSASASSFVPLSDFGGAVSSEMVSLVERLANRALQQGYPIKAACHYLSINDVQRAVRLLLRCNETDLAAGISIAMRLTSCDEVLWAMANRCVNLGQVETGVDFLKKGARDAKAKIASICSRADSLQIADVDKIYAKSDMNPVEFYARNAAAAEQTNRLECILSYAASRNHSKAALFALIELKEFFGRPAWDWMRIQAVADVMHSLNAQELEPPLRVAFLAYMNLVGAQVAIWKGYWRIVPALITNVQTLVSNLSSPHEFPVSPFMLKYMSCLALAHIDAKEALPVLELFIRTLNADPSQSQLYQSVLRLKSLLQENGGTTLASSSSNQVLPSFYNLPARDQRGEIAYSVITKKEITGEIFILEDGTSMISKAEAIQWSRVNPFSPLCTGKRLIPF